MFETSPPSFYAIFLNLTGYSLSYKQNISLSHIIMSMPARNKVLFEYFAKKIQIFGKNQLNGYI